MVFKYVFICNNQQVDTKFFASNDMGHCDCVWKININGIEITLSKQKLTFSLTVYFSLWPNMALFHFFKKKNCTVLFLALYDFI